MNELHLRRLIVTAACWFALLGGSGTGYCASNYLHNAGFEDQGSSSRAALYWEYENPNIYGMMFGNARRQSWRAKSGFYEGVICGSWFNTNVTEGAALQQFRIEGGRSYTASGWFWSDDGIGNSFTSGWMGIYISYYTNAPDSGNEVAGDSLFFEPPGSIWTYHELTLEAPAEAEWAEIYIFAWDTGFNGALQFDDLFFGVTDDEPATPPGPMARRTALIASEIMYHPSVADTEFVELFNTDPFSQDLSGYSLDGDISYTFPEGTVIGPTGYLVIASSPSVLESVYGISGVLGPYKNTLPDNGGMLRVLNESGAVLLDIKYEDKAPWPAAADGAGFALVPEEESFGPSDVRSWKAGCYTGGSPGQADPAGMQGYRSVLINEVLTHTDEPLGDYVELYNSSGKSIDLTGCILTDSKTNDWFVLPAGTVIAPCGYLSFDTNMLHFNLSSYGEAVFLKGPGGTGLIDAVEFGGLPNGIAYGRWPDGGSLWGALQSRTEGGSNTPFAVGDVVINEIMYHPISEDDRDEYIELYNQGSASVDVSGWRLSDAIDFVFPAGTVIPPNGYLVVAKDAVHLIGNHETLSVQNTVGNYNGKLSDSSDRIVLEALDDPLDPVAAWVVIDEVAYDSGGRWGSWSDGGGSSLELKDARSDNRLPSNWADSDETHKSSWVTNTITRKLANGMLVAGTSITQVQLFLLRTGECLVDEVCVVPEGGANLVLNPGFEEGDLNWDKRGTHGNSALTDFDAAAGSRSEWIRASDGGDSRGNGLAGDLSRAVHEGDSVTLSVQARWLQGSPFLYLRLLGGYLSQVFELPVPANLGTPGAQNSTYVENAGPAITDVRHDPLLPAAYENITVSARIDDADGIDHVTLYYRNDPSTYYSSTRMTSDSRGEYSGNLWDYYNAGALAAFYIEAYDRNGNSTRFPADAPDRECLIRFGESNAGESLGAYHIALTEASMNTWSNRSPLNNHPLDCTFIADDRVIYNAGIRYRGSPFLRKTDTWIHDPQSASAAYRIEFPKDDRYLDAAEMNLDWQETGRDTTYQGERTAFWLARKIGLPAIHQRYVVVYLNGKKRGVIYTDSQHIEEDYIKSWYPDRTTGDLHKINDWMEYEANLNATNFVSKDANLVDYRVSGNRDVERYRWNWERNSCGSYNQDYTSLMTLVDAANLATNRTVALDAVIDVRQWMKTIALRHVVDDWDSFGFDRGKNMFAYRPDLGKWDLLNWDIDFGFGAGSGNGPTTDVFKVEQNVMPLMYDLLHHDYAFRRCYWQAIEQLANGPMADPSLNTMIDEVQTALLNAGLTEVYGTEKLKDWIAGRRTYLQDLLNTVTNISLTVDGIAAVDSGNVVRLTGKAPAQVYSIMVDGEICIPTWLSDTDWELFWPMTQTQEFLLVQGCDWDGMPVPDSVVTQRCTVTVTAEPPEDSLVINEIMYHPASNGVAFIELFNRSSNTTFNLCNYRLRGVDLTFEELAVILPQGYLVVAADRQRFVNQYGVSNIPVADWNGTLSNDGESLALLQLNRTGGVETVVDEVFYTDEAPWPVEADGQGASLQLVDCAQDNNRVGNWAVDMAAGATPYAANSVRDVLPAFPDLRINEIQSVNQTTVQDAHGDYDPWMEWHNGAGEALSLSNYYVTDDYAQLDKWAFPSQAVVDAQGFLLVWADGETNQQTASEWHAPFVLNEASGQLAVVHAHEGRMIIVDYVNYQNIPHDRSYGDFTDGHWTNRLYFAHPTPGFANNGTPMPPLIVINEWLADNKTILQDPQEPGSYEDWFELYNAGYVDVDLEGYSLTDNPDETRQWIIPSNTLLRAGEYRLVWADNDEEDNLGGTNDLHVNFKLNADGEYIGLYNGEGVLVDSVIFGPQTADVSEGCFPDTQRPCFSFERPTPYARNLISTNCYGVLLSAGSHGGITPTGTVEVLHGYDQEIEIMADRYYVVEQVLTNGSPVEGTSGSNACSLILRFVTAPIEVVASFRALASTNGTPAWWLAEYELTNAPLDEAAGSDSDGDGFSADEEYVAGTTPIDSNSCFTITELHPGESGAPVMIWTPSVSGRVYSIRSSESLNQTPQTITNLVYPACCYTVHMDQAAGFFQVGVELE